MKLRNIAIVPSTVIAAGVAATSAMAQVGQIPDRNGSYFYGPDMMWGGSQWGGFGMFLGPIFMILIVVGIVAGIVYLLRLFSSPGTGGGTHVAHDRAMMLLKERFAKGEIDPAEFAERKKLLDD